MATKKQREQLFNKFGGKCAYCGCELGKGWHVDEVEPCRREYQWDRQKMKSVLSGYTHPERLHIDNQNPSCASCNINKHSMSLEEFRASIAQFVQSLNLYSTQYKIAKRYGLIQEVEKPVLFYFELVQMNKFEMIYGQQERIPKQAELKPCPLCGGEANFSGMYPAGQYYVQCEDCRVHIWADRQDKAIGMWNQRIKQPCEKENQKQ